MTLNCGIVGLPNVGKSTLFNALTASRVEAANYPFCTIEPNVGVVAVADDRLPVIARYIDTDKIVPATVAFHDIAGLVRGAASGEGLGNKFLGHIRTTDAIVHVLRCFEAGDITHVEEQLDPLRDLEIVQTELIIKDHTTVVSSLHKQQKLAKANPKQAQPVIEMLVALEAHLQAIQPARTFVNTNDQLTNVYRDLHLLTAKPALYVCNVDLDDRQNDHVQRLSKQAEQTGAEVVCVCAKIEEELAQLVDDEKQEMLQELGLKEAGLNRLVKAAYRMLGLQAYFTAGRKEIKAWTIKRGDNAPTAAGKIHSDFARGFICAEVFTVDDLRRVGSKAKLKERGLIRTEGRDYIVQDGDIIEFRFNV